MHWAAGCRRGVGMRDPAMRALHACRIPHGGVPACLPAGPAAGTAVPAACACLTEEGLQMWRGTCGVWYM